MSKQMVVYNRFKAEIAKNPDTPVKQLAEKLKLNPGYYYKIRRQLADQNQPKRKYKKLKLESAPANQQQLMLVLGSPEQLKEFVGSIL